MWAARCNQKENIQVFEKYGGDLNLSTDMGNALHQACAVDHYDIVEYLLAQKIKIDVQDKNGDTPLHVCAINGSNNSLMTILTYLSLQIDEEEDETKQGQYKDEFKKLLNIQNNIGNTVLHECALNER